MTESSMRLALPMIDAGQVDKSTTHNEALALIDLAVAPEVIGPPANIPPASPAVGDCHLVGASPTGAWAGHALALAGYTTGGWRFIAAIPGLRATDKASGHEYVFRAGIWEAGLLHGSSLSISGSQVVGARQAAVADPTGGATIDAEARAAIGAILARLRQHGLIAT